MCGNSDCIAAPHSPRSSGIRRTAAARIHAGQSITLPPYADAAATAELGVCARPYHSPLTRNGVLVHFAGFQHFNSPVMYFYRFIN